MDGTNQFVVPISIIREISEEARKWRGTAQEGEPKFLAGLLHVKYWPGMK